MAATERDLDELMDRASQGMMEALDRVYPAERVEEGLRELLVDAGIPEDQWPARLRQG